MAKQPVRKKEKKAKDHIPQNRSFCTQSLADASRPVLKPILGRQGFSAMEIVTNWAAIVGPRLALHSLPLKLTRPRFEGHEGVLHLRVAPGGFALEIQHQEPQILERVNAYFGYRAAGKLRITQGPLPSSSGPSAPPSAPSLSTAQKVHLDTALQTIENPGLKAALKKLGGHVMASNKARSGENH